MNVTQRGLDIIMQFEGFSSRAYQCPAGVWTIGYGHTKGVKKGHVCTPAQAQAYLLADCADAVAAVNRLNGRFNQNQFDALVSFAFNCGEGNLRLLCVDRLKEKNYSGIGAAIAFYNKANGQVLKGLTSRRAAEQKLFQTLPA